MLCFVGGGYLDRMSLAHDHLIHAVLGLSAELLLVQQHLSHQYQTPLRPVPRPRVWHKLCDDSPYNSVGELHYRAEEREADGLREGCERVVDALVQTTHARVSTSTCVT